MGLLKGTISYTKFFVQGEVDDNFHKHVLKKIASHAFTPLKHDDDVDEKVGWARIDSPLVLPVEIDGTALYNEYINLAFRIDKYRFPSSVVKSRLEEATRNFLEKKGRSKLTKSEKEELKALVIKKLKKEFDPVAKVIDVSWNTNTNIVRFWSQTGSAIEKFDELFEKTFACKLIVASPYTHASALGLNDAQTRVMSKIERSAFHADVRAA